MVTVNAGPAAEVSVVTFNIRGIMDRWPERAPLLRRCLKQADADVFCFQEVLTGGLGLAGKQQQCAGTN
jgi:exonuclease III